MSNRLFSELAWLPAAPADFAEQCRALPNPAHDIGKRAQWLANRKLDESQLNRLSKALRKARAAGHSLAPLSPFRLGILSNATSHFIVPALEATALRYGIALECVEADYGQVAQSALDPESAIHRAGCDAVLLAIDHRGLSLDTHPGDASAAEETRQRALAELDTIRAGLHRHGKAVCILQTLARPVESCFGSLDFALPGTERFLIDELNRGIARSIVGTSDLLLDVAHLAETVGLADWHDPTLWNLGKLPFASAFLPLYADQLCRLLGALRGKSRKCLVLDLDNTLWGGVIGDDGLEGIVLGQGDATGEAHLHVQRTALMLRGRGVVLAVSSKNTDGVAREPFRKHPDMALREDHIAVFQANWQDKATNIRAIAEELSLGLDALVFLDDNPMERELVRQMLPEVAVPELPADPALYARALLAAGYFEAVAFSEEDKQRADFYRDNARRVALRQQAGNVLAYLQSLNMELTLRPFDAAGRARIAQLINKSNQFNLTTRRYTEAEVEAAELDPNAFTLQARLTDTFGDNGIISVLICRAQASDWRIDTWLMSCRVLGRRVEHAALQELVLQARARGIQRLLGEYIPTEKNQLVRDHYANLGFSCVAQHDDGRSSWALSVDDAVLGELPLTVRRVDLAAPEQPAPHETVPASRRVREQVTAAGI